MAVMLLLCVLWASILSQASCQVDRPACPYNESAALEYGRTCSNKPCVDRADCKGNRRCLCDGLCGYRCISYKSTKLCNELQAPDNGSVKYLSDDQSFGSKAIYQCDRGYILSESTERTCLGDGNWTTEMMPTCLLQDEGCPRLPEQDRAGNRSCKQRCSIRKDCEMKKIEDCLCDSDCGMSCLPVYVTGYCPELQLPEGTRAISMAPRGRIYKSVATLGCEEGYEPVDGRNERIRCLIDKTWSAEPLSCTRKVNCNAPPVIDRLHHDRPGEPSYPGDTLTYTCRPGYHSSRITRIVSTCQADLTWTPVSIDCYASSCGNPRYPQNGYREGNIFTFLNSVNFFCNPGFRMIGRPISTCLSDGSWSASLPRCQAIECPEIYPPDNGIIDGRGREFEDRVYFECYRGYRLLGSEVRRCQANGAWSGQETTCKAVKCPMPERPRNGDMIVSRLTLNAIVIYSCDDGYTLVGKEVVKCTEYDTWSAPAPECQARCIVPKPPDNGYYVWQSYQNTRGERSSVGHGTVIEVRCNERYSLNSREQFRCVGNEWSFEPQCIPDPCGKLPESSRLRILYPSNVNQSAATVPHNTEASIKCVFGFEPEDTVNLRCWFGSWGNRGLPECRPKHCESEVVAHGEVRYYSEDSDVALDIGEEGPYHGLHRTVNCSTGFTRAYALRNTSACNNGDWTSLVPACLPDQCSPLTDTGGDIEYTDTDSLQHGSSAQVTCSRGQKPSVGNGSLVCHAGHWVPDGVVCIDDGEAFNVAYGMPAVQSSGLDESPREPASLIVDGDRTIDYLHGSCVTAQRSDSLLFLEVDLQGAYQVASMVIYHKPKTSKLQQGTVTVGISGTPIESYMQCGNAISKSMSKQDSFRVVCSPEPISGQIVRIQLPPGQPAEATLCEVEVYATGPIATCTIPSISNLIVKFYGSSYTLPSNLQIPVNVLVGYQCDEGYKMIGNPANSCHPDGSWVYAEPYCKAAPCKNVRDPLHGRLTVDFAKGIMEHGTYLQYECDESYEKQNENIQCRFGELEPGPARCIPASCRFDESDFQNVLINGEEPILDASGKVVIPHDTIITFGCQEGFTLQPENILASWCWHGDVSNLDTLPSCEPVRCAEPPSLQHGTYRIVGDSNEYRHGISVRYQCNAGYVLQDVTTEYSMCQNGVWSGATKPVCQQILATQAPRLLCPTPSVFQANIYLGNINIAESHFNYTYVEGNKVTARCTLGLLVNGKKSVTLTCRSGAWQPASPHCIPSIEQSCSRPNDIDNTKVVQYFDGRIKLDDTHMTEFSHKSTIVSRCRKPLEYRLATEPKRTCMSGRWIGPKPYCERPRVYFRFAPYHSMLFQYFANSTVLIHPGVGHLNIDCVVQQGYTARLTDSSGLVNTGRRSSLGVPRESYSGQFTCARGNNPSINHVLQILVKDVSCPRPKTPLNGHLIGQDFRITKEVSFSCDEGYELIGASRIKCVLGTWIYQGDIPSCRALGCPEIRLEDPNINVTNYDNTPGSTVTFYCRSGFDLVGEMFLYCEDGRWSSPFPHCEDASVPSTTPAQLDCQCEMWERCIVGDNGLRMCQCIHPTQCHQGGEAGEEEAVCGTDGNTYSSLCKMKTVGCYMEVDLEVASRGPCPEYAEPSTFDPSSDDSSFLPSSQEGTDMNITDDTTTTGEASPAVETTYL